MKTPHLRLLILFTLAPAFSFAETSFRAIAVGATPESVVPGFNGKLHVTLMGPKREKGDGDGQIVVVDGDKVTVLASGFHDPKGLVFLGDRLITADFDEVWSIDADGRKTLLAGPDAFPKPPLYLNDIAIDRRNGSILVTDMGDLAAMHQSPGVFWPLESEQARTIAPRGRIYRISPQGTVSVAIDHSPEMPNPNGIDLLEDGSILIAEFFRGTLLEWKANQWRTISDDHRSGDGIAHDAKGNLYVTEVRTGRVWHIRRDTGERRLLATLRSAADLYLDESNHQLVVPDSKAGTLVFIPLENK